MITKSAIATVLHTDPYAPKGTIEIDGFGLCWRGTRDELPAVLVQLETDGWAIDTSALEKP